MNHIRHFETITELEEAITTIAVGQQVTVKAKDVPIAKNRKLSFKYFLPEEHIAVFLNGGYSKNEEKIFFIRCQ